MVLTFDDNVIRMQYGRLFDFSNSNREGLVVYNSAHSNSGGLDFGIKLCDENSGVNFDKKSETKIYSLICVISILMEKTIHA